VRDPSGGRRPAVTLPVVDEDRDGTGGPRRHAT
jgi:hypothetical protein